MRAPIEEGQNYYYKASTDEIEFSSLITIDDSPSNEFIMPYVNFAFGIPNFCNDNKKECIINLCNEINRRYPTEISCEGFGDTYSHQSLTLLRTFETPNPHFIE